MLETVSSESFLPHSSQTYVDLAMLEIAGLFYYLGCDKATLVGKIVEFLEAHLRVLRIVQ